VAGGIQHEMVPNQFMSFLGAIVLLCGETTEVQEVVVHVETNR
jgi:hypothetical protein